MLWRVIKRGREIQAHAGETAENQRSRRTNDTQQLNNKKTEHRAGTPGVNDVGVVLSRVVIQITGIHPIDLARVGHETIAGAGDHGLHSLSIEILSGQSTAFILIFARHHFDGSVVDVITLLAQYLRSSKVQG